MLSDIHFSLPTWSSKLANLYWHKRICRKHDNAGRRRAWRKIAEEKKRLLQLGIPYIEVHLVTRHLTNPGNRNATDRMTAYYDKCEKGLTDVIRI